MIYNNKIGTVQFLVFLVFALSFTLPKYPKIFDFDFNVIVVDKQTTEDISQIIPELIRNPNQINLRNQVEININDQLSFEDQISVTVTRADETVEKLQN